MRHWLRRAYLNVKGFLAALLASVLPGASPFVRKLLVYVVTSAAIAVYRWLGLDFPVGDADIDGVINSAVEAIMVALGGFALWRIPNDQPTATELQNPVVRTATTIPPT